MTNGKVPTKPRTTDVWPLQTFQWKDLHAPREGKFRYRIFVVRGTATKPVVAMPSGVAVLVCTACA